MKGFVRSRFDHLLIDEIEPGGPTKYRVALILAFVAAVLCFVPMQQIIRDPDEVSNSSSKDVEAFDRYLAELSQYGASGQEVLEVGVGVGKNDSEKNAMWETNLLM